MTKTQLLDWVDFYNLASIEVLEALGMISPSERQINRIETILKRILGKRRHERKRA